MNQDIGAPELIECPACGARQLAYLFQSVNPARVPGIKQDLLEGRFMRHPCRGCGHVLEIERDLLWLDLEAGWMILCLEPSARADLDGAEALAREVFQTTAVEQCPPAVKAIGRKLRLRVVFGYEPLREKVLCAEVGLDDRLVEYTKLAILFAHPEWKRPGFLGLRLVSVSPTELVFQQEADGPKAQLAVVRSMMEEIAKNPSHFQTWAPRVAHGIYVDASTVPNPWGDPPPRRVTERPKPAAPPPGELPDWAIDP